MSWVESCSRINQGVMFVDALMCSTTEVWDLFVGASSRVVGRVADGNFGGY